MPCLIAMIIKKVKGRNTSKIKPDVIVNAASCGEIFFNSHLRLFMTTDAFALRIKSLTILLRTYLSGKDVFGANNA